MRRPLLVITLLLLLLGGSWLFKERQQGPPEPSAIAEAPIDYYFKGVRAVSMNEKGLPRERLESKALSHHPHQHTASLDQPRLWLRNEQGQVWRLRADSGQLHGDGERLELSGKVRLTRPAQGELGPLQLRSERMSIHPQEGYASSDVAVRISSPRAQINAMGMHAYMNEQRLELPAEVTASYDPNHP